MSHGPRPAFVSWVQEKVPGVTVSSGDLWSPIFDRGAPLKAEIVWPVVVTIGCECGLEAHPGESCEGALACVDAMCEGCTCCGYWNPETREVQHGGFCDLVPSPEGCDECGLTWLHCDGCSHDGEGPRWHECACGLGCSWGNGCLRVRRGPVPEDEHDGAHVFAGPCEVAL